MDDLVGLDAGHVTGLNIQPLLDKIVQNADIGTLVLILVIFILLILLFAERARSGNLTKNYMKQSIEVVKVLTSLKALMDANVRHLELSEVAIAAITQKLQEVRALLDKPPTKSRRRRKPQPKVDTSSSDDSQEARG